MSDSNLFKISIYEAHIESKKDISKPITPRKAGTPNKSHKSRKSIFKQQYHFQLALPKIQTHKSTTIKAENGTINRNKLAPAQQQEHFQSHRSVASCKSHRKVIDCTSKPNLTKKFQRPQSAMIKKSRKRSWQTYNTKIPLFRQADIILKNNQKLKDSQDDCVAFLKQKCMFVRVVKIQQDLEWEPIENEYTVKIFGRIQMQNKTYFVVQNFNSTSIANIIDSFGPCKQTLVSKQIRSLVIGVMYFHNRGIIHNRLNPDTVFMNKQGNFLIDFVKNSQKPLQQPERQKYFHYFSPQLLTKGLILQSSDVWSIGCLALQMLTGRISESCLHPYNEACDASPSSNNEQIKKLKQLRLKCKTQKRSEFCNEQTCKKAEEELSKKAKSFINTCLRINYKVRIDLSMLIDHEFLRQ